MAAKPKPKGRPTTPKAAAEQDKERRAASTASLKKTRAMRKSVIEDFPFLTLRDMKTGEELDGESQNRIVSILVACGVPVYSLAIIFGLTPEKVSERFRKQLDEGSNYMVGRTAVSLFEIANSPFYDARARVPAAIFLLKSRGGWREADKVPLNEPPGLNREQATFNYNNLSARERATFLSLLDKASAKPMALEGHGIPKDEKTEEAA